MRNEAKGQITEFWDNASQLQAIGKFISQFSQLEHSIRHLLSDLLELTPDQFNIVSASYDFATLCRVVSAFIRSLPQCDEETENEVVDLFKRCLEVNDARVKMVHGTWDETGTTHISRGTFKPGAYFQSNEEMTKLTTDIKLCMNRVVKIIDGEAATWARETRELIRDL